VVNRVAPNLTFFKFGRSRIWPNFGTQIRPKPKLNLAETCFLVTEEYSSDKTNGVNNAVSRHRQYTSVLPLLRYCLPVIDKICRISMNRFCILNCFSSILVFYLHCQKYRISVL